MHMNHYREGRGMAGVHDATYMHGNVYTRMHIDRNRHTYAFKDVLHECIKKWHGKVFFD